MTVNGWTDVTASVFRHNRGLVAGPSGQVSGGALFLRTWGQINGTIFDANSASSTSVAQAGTRAFGCPQCYCAVFCH